MSAHRILTLLKKEFIQGPKNYMFIFAVVMPVVISLVVTLLFGTVFSGKARLGLVDEGDSLLPELAQDLDGLTVSQYASAAALRTAIELGSLDMKLVLSSGFDSQVRSGEPIELTVFTWGESHLKNRVILATALVHLMREIAGQEPPVEIVTTTLGEVSVPWEQRLLPFIVIVAVLLWGIFIPATSLVEEKQKRTIVALGVTSATTGEILTAKGVIGIVVSTVSGVVILFLNQAFGNHPLLLVALLVSGSLMASAGGVLMGVTVKDINSLFTMMKGLGIFLYAPALIYMFPEIPQWIARIFPTNYIIQPVIEVVQEGAGWGDVLPEMAVTLAIVALLIGLIRVVSRRMQHQLA